MQGNAIFEIYRHMSALYSSSSGSGGIYKGGVYIELYNQYTGGYVRSGLMYNGHSNPSTYADTSWYGTSRDSVNNVEITTYLSHSDKDGLIGIYSYSNGQYAWVCCGVPAVYTFSDVPTRGFCYYSTNAETPWDTNATWTRLYAGTTISNADTRYTIQSITKDDD